MPESPPFSKVLIANRGEISIRIARTLRELGIRSVAVYSDADKDAPHVRAADEAEHIGPAMPRQSYLDQQQILDAAKRTSAAAIHPGYGFLSENAEFAHRCREAGLVFIGPPAEVIDTMGSKIASRRAAAASGMPIVPGSDGPVSDAGEIESIAVEIGYPIAIKASAGGGGYGMRVVNEPGEIVAAFDGVRRDGERAFGDATAYVEKFFDPAPRHVEIQILADSHGSAIALGERECSLQRRFQKVVEWTPSPAVDSALREKMSDAATKLAREVGYVNAGTIECLVDVGGRFHFLEMNTRLQVEHPVTEMVTGIDLVREMLNIAAGRELSVDGNTPFDGHAIEVRIYAEDPQKNFMPSPGVITGLTLPDLPGVRIDSAVEVGTNVSVYYDPLVAKVSAWGADRAEAVRTLAAALEQFEFEGIKSNLPFLRHLVTTPDFETGNVHTRYIDQHLPELVRAT
jgi:acetyl-CoA carboxylase biotin carboxylase subunit